MQEKLSACVLVLDDRLQNVIESIMCLTNNHEAALDAVQISLCAVCAGDDSADVVEIIVNILKDESV